MPTELFGQEFVGYAYLLVDHKAAAACLWTHAVEQLCLEDQVGAYPNDLPEHFDTTAEPKQGIIALRERSDVGLHQVVLRRVHDVLVLGVLRSFGNDGTKGWQQAESDWETLVGPRRVGLLGAARILQGRVSSKGPLSVDEELCERVGAAVDGSAANPAWTATGTVVRSAGLGKFAVWTAPERGGGDIENHRRLVVLAKESRDAELSAWTWSRGTPEMTPLASYLLHAATLRGLASRRPDVAGLHQMLRENDQALGALVEHISPLAKDDAADPDGLIRASARVRALQADEFGLIAALGERERLLAAVGVTTANMAAYLDIRKPGGPFADDSALADWHCAQLRVEEASLRERLQRGRSITDEADSLLQSALQDRGEEFQLRRERINLAATGVVSALLMALAAIQAFQYKVPVPDQVKGPVVFVLTCLALLSSLLVLRSWNRTGRRQATALVVLAATLLGAGVGWTVASVVAELSGRIAPSNESWLGAGVGALIALVSAVTASRAGGRENRSDLSPPDTKGALVRSNTTEPCPTDMAD
ncbi:CATRA conflict system CASPASE/TPR repeat-associated protein [Actinomycetospora chiangmaiensis]|uniref:CATRA conflict system CASPASE/TPR repeat-associated protein n=1 Tax=Actinomycetospora chiangmaiensis TaxID=402650 RepID=UPI000368E4C4|nr:CATRA conflict system CASPASE/TPR repeat-associated protein [Actinomycetospora chiangmaiensis]